MIFFYLSSFFLDGFLPNHPIFQRWIPMTSFCIFFLSVPRYYKKEKVFHRISLFFGIFYDLIYTTHFGFYTFLFFLLSYFITFCYHEFSYKLPNLFWQFSLFSFFYHFISAFLFSSFPIFSIFLITFASLPFNFLFLILAYPFFKLPIKSLKGHKLYRM